MIDINFYLPFLKRKPIIYNILLFGLRLTYQYQINPKTMVEMSS